MCKIKIGDLVYYNDRFSGKRYCVVQKIISEDIINEKYIEVYGNWYNSIEEAKKRCSVSNYNYGYMCLKDVFLAKKKEIKPFGIVNFCNKYY